MALGIPSSVPIVQNPEKYSFLVTQADGTWKEIVASKERRSLMEYDYKKTIGPRSNSSMPGGFSGGFGGGGFR